MLMAEGVLRDPIVPAARAKKRHGSPSLDIDRNSIH
jgi:hypothetical protein